MESTTPRRRPRRRRSALAALLLLAGFFVAMPTIAHATSYGADAVAVLGESPELIGVDGARPGDREIDPAAVATTVDGVQCWAMQESPLVRYVYVNVADAVVPEGARRAIVTVDYYDVGTNGFDIQYDAQSTPWAGSRNQPMTDSHQWRTTSFELTDIRFQNRSNGADFRLNVKAPVGGMSPVCFSKIEVRFTDAPMAALDSLAIMSPSLIFAEGEARIDVASPASQVNWRVSDAYGVEIRTGISAMTTGAGTIDVSDLGFGYYTLDVTAPLGTPVTRSTSFAVLDAPPAGWNADDAFYGVGLHRGWQSPRDTTSLIEAIALAGYGLSRIDQTWEGIEPTAGNYTFDTLATATQRELSQHGVNAMWNALYKNPLYDNNQTPHTPSGIAAFAAYAGATAGFASAESLTHDVGVYNEYNSSGFNSSGCLTAACYVALLEPTASAIHAADPQANVMGPVTAGVQLDWARDFIDRGGLDSIDTYAVNYYGVQNFGPGTAPEESEAVTALPELVDLVHANDGGRDIPVRITENGWATHTAGSSAQQQADFAIRGPVLAEAAGVDSYIWYAIMDTGFNPSEREDNFGLLNRPDATSCWNWICPDAPGYTYGGVHGISPKPAFVTQAVLIRQTTGLEQQPREDLSSPTAYSYPYTDGTRTNRVLWSTAADHVTVSSANGFTLTDEFGTKTEVGAGDFSLTLDESPVFISGTVTLALTPAPFAVDVADQTVAGGAATVTVTALDAGIRPRTVTVMGDGVKQTFHLAGGSVQMTLPAASRLGRRTITVTVAQGGQGQKPMAQLRAHTQVIDGYEVIARPGVTREADDYAYALDVTVRNNDPDHELRLDSLTWRVGATAGTIASPPVVPPGTSATVAAAVPAPALFVPLAYEVRAAAGGYRHEDVGTLSFSPIEPDDATRVDPIDLNRIGVWRANGSGTRGGTADVGGSVRFTSLPGGLRVHAEITDDKHIGSRASASQAWQVDSIQFSTYDLFPSLIGGHRVEIAAALLDGGPVTYTFAAPPGAVAGPTPGAQTSITRNEETRTTVYDVSVPWSSLGFDEPPQSVFGLSFLVNDADGDVTGTDGRSGWVEWGGGIGQASKNTALFRSANLISAEAE
ncbi:hypothetical protein [Microbacterium nymphoidis]|uniref:hypothetical protein n=1 Tax=Microbacterium nymphoidis TaxID=2898586 RepID=UPI001E2AB7F1|nr:hypothetical protein [Microbacterium nymphoidis]MCD2498850.1 hypothetical protein [Microbacterium nymphoidis]